MALENNEYGLNHETSDFASIAKGILEKKEKEIQELFEDAQTRHIDLEDEILDGNPTI